MMYSDGKWAVTGGGAALNDRNLFGRWVDVDWKVGAHLWNDSWIAQKIGINDLVDRT